MRRPIKPKVFAAQAAYIDPADCGSIVAYTIVGRHRLTAELNLSDCNRKIDWYFGTDSDSGVKKIDKVIELLTAFRKDFILASKAWKKPRRIKRRIKFT